MKVGRYTLACSVLCWSAVAQTVPPTLRVTAETAPPGGMAQIKVLLTSPKPIILGDTTLDLSAVSFSSIDGIELFSPPGMWQAPPC